MEAFLEEFLKLSRISSMEKGTDGSTLMVTTRIAKVCQFLNKNKVRYVVVGGEAGILHGLTRTTEDIDIFIEKNIENAEKALNALSNLMWGVAKEIPPEKILKDPITIIGDQPRVDILTSLKDISFEKAWSLRNKANIEGVEVPYLALDLLIKSKDTDRLQDIADKEQLERIKKLKKK